MTQSALDWIPFHTRKRAHTSTQVGGYPGAKCLSQGQIDMWEDEDGCKPTTSDYKLSTPPPSHIDTLKM